MEAEAGSQLMLAPHPTPLSAWLRSLVIQRRVLGDPGGILVQGLSRSVVPCSAGWLILHRLRQTAARGEFAVKTVLMVYQLLSRACCLLH